MPLAVHPGDGVSERLLHRPQPHAGVGLGAGVVAGGEIEHVADALGGHQRRPAQPANQVADPPHHPEGRPGHRHRLQGSARHSAHDLQVLGGVQQVPEHDVALGAPARPHGRGHHRGDVAHVDEAHDVPLGPGERLGQPELHRPELAGAAVVVGADHQSRVDDHHRMPGLLVGAGQDLALGLGGGIGRPGLPHRVVCGDRVGGERVQGHGGGDVDDGVAARGDGRVEHVGSAGQVDGLYLGRPARVRPHHGGGVHGRVAAVDGFVHRGGVGDVAVHDFERFDVHPGPGGDRLQLGRGADQGPHLVAGLGQDPDGVGADEPGGPGDHDLHDRTLIDWTSMMGPS